MTKKVQLVTSKLDQAHGKAREIEAVVIASIAFDNRFCHALTLNRYLFIVYMKYYLSVNIKRFISLPTFNFVSNFFLFHGFIFIIAFKVIGTH